MARYIDADKLINKMFPIGLVDYGRYTINAKVVRVAIDQTPTADVAPKSEVAREIVEIINDRIDNIRARTPYGGRAQGKTLALEKMRLLESLKVEIAKKYTEGEG